jgi:hypothetical protein
MNLFCQRNEPEILCIMTLMKIVVCTQKKNYKLSHRQAGLRLEKYYYTVKKETPRQQ